MQKKIAWVLAFALVAAVSFGLGAVASGGFGTQSDPLVSLSYLTDTLTPQVLDEVTRELEFRVVTLNNGQTLTGQVGCELLLRIGSAVCKASDSPGLVDSTDASNLNNGGALVTNHLYLVTIEGHGFTATANGTKVLVKGSYTIS